MKCKFCAEEIKDDAIVCRFCGAVKESGVWKAPTPRFRAMAGAVRKGTFTIRGAGVLFVVSGVFELFYLTSAVPLFGAVRGGGVAVLYHLLDATLFVGIGAGLWRGSRWGYWLVFLGTLLYTLDRALYLLDQKTMEAQLTQQLQAYPGISEMFDKGALLEAFSVATMLFVACWWGFALYIYLRRGYFSAEATTEAEHS